MAQCITPYHVRMLDRDNELVPVPCGKCPACVARRTSAWSFRLMQEGLVSESSMFVTLTYDTDHVPITSKGFMSLNRKEMPAFMKRLRKRNTAKLRYYGVGEYGSKSLRPHYHMLLFNAKLDTVFEAWKAPPRGDAKRPPSPIGDIHYGTVTGASIGYTLKYMAKPGIIPLHQNDDRVKEFALMSKGIGANYCSDNMKQWHIADLTKRMYCVIEDGKKMSMPRYYKDRIYNEDQRETVAMAMGYELSLQRDKYEADMLKTYGENWRHYEIERHKHSFTKMQNNAGKNKNL